MKHLNSIFFFFLACSALTAQRNPQPAFRNYSTEHGLPSPEVYCAFQDSRGYMWFGTDNGAARFDGYAFRTYGPKDGLDGNVVFNIHEDGQKRIWFGTITGEAFLLEAGRIRPYKYNGLVQQYRQERYADSELLYVHKNGTAYFELTGVGVLRIDPLGKDSLISSSLPYATLVIELPGQGRLQTVRVNWPSANVEKRYFLDRTFPVEIVRPAFRAVKKLPVVQAEFNKILRAEATRSGHILVLGRGYWHCLQGDSLLWSVPAATYPNEIRIDEKDGIWLCLSQGQGLKYFPNTDALKNGRYSEFLKGYSISDYYKDTKGGVWVTTQEKGVFYYADFDLSVYDFQYGFSGAFVSTIAFIDDSTLYAGCENGDIFRVDLSENELVKVKNKPWGYHNEDMWYDPESQRLWCEGMYLQDGQWHSLKLRKEYQDYISNSLLIRWDKIQKHGSRRLLGCNFTGIHIVHLAQDSLGYVSSLHGLRERTFAVHSDAVGRVWVGNARGLFEFKGNRLEKIPASHPAFNRRIEDIVELDGGSVRQAHAGALVLGTKGWGVVIWKSDTILSITEAEGLTSNMIEDLHVDDNNILWIGTLNGLNKAVPDAKGLPRIRRFTMANGLPSNEIYQIKSWRGQVWLCTAAGLARFHERAEDTLATAPELQHLRANGADMPLIAGQELQHGNNSLEFRFLAINFRQNGRIPYRYRLSKAAPWQYTQNLTANYPQLPPGSYHFEVQAQNEFGYWSPSAAYAFAILPPWWQTWWARALAAGLALGGMFYYQRLRIARLKKEAAIQQQIAGLERSALQAQMNPHFIFNCLNSIQNFILNNDKKKAVEFLARFARLVRHNLNASVQGRVSLAEEVQILENYLALERERFSQEIDYRITVEEGLEEEGITFPPLLIQPYVENAVVHGLAKKAGGGTVAIHFHKDNGALAVTIRDNGLGYRQDGNEAPSARHRSVGMTITQKRLELLGGTDGKAVQVEVLKGEDGEVLGTEVRVRVGSG